MEFVILYFSSSVCEPLFWFFILCQKILYEASNFCLKLKLKLYCSWRARVDIPCSFVAKGTWECGYGSMSSFRSRVGNWDCAEGNYTSKESCLSILLQLVCAKFMSICLSCFFRSGDWFIRFYLSNIALRGLQELWPGLIWHTTCILHLVISSLDWNHFLLKPWIR